MANFSERLRSLRKMKGLSQQDLANQIGMVSKSSINMYERGEREPNFETLEAIADYFNVDLDYLLGKSDISNKSDNWTPELEEVLRLTFEDQKAGLENARKSMVQTHAENYVAHSVRRVGNKTALLYYRAFNSDSVCSAISVILSCIEDLDEENVEKIMLLVESYRDADERTRQMVDLALQPYNPVEISGWV